MAEIVDTKVGIPESITINGVTYLVKETPELQQFIQSVAKVEKTKLYSKFEDLKAQISNLGNVKVENTPALDMDALIEKLQGTFVTKEDFKENLSGIVKEVVQPVLNATEQTRKNELEQYRDKIISENAATCIPDLVKGETKEELDSSLKESIRLRAAYPSPNTEHKTEGKVVDPVIQAQASKMGASATPTPESAPQNPTPTPPPAPRIPAPEAGSMSTGTKSMSMKEFGERRDTLLKNLEDVYGGGSL
mgnify:CR=1 FL=1